MNYCPRHNHSFELSCVQCDDILNSAVPVSQDDKIVELQFWQDVRDSHTVMVPNLQARLESLLNRHVASYEIGDIDALIKEVMDGQ